MSPRLYSLFHKVNGKHVRQTGLAFPKKQAVLFFQSALLSGCFAGKSPSLRHVKRTYNLRQLENVAGGSAMSVHDCCKELDNRVEA
jgi:hypothetical protein